MKRFLSLILVAFMAVTLHGESVNAIVKKLKGKVEYAEPGSKDLKPLKEGALLPTGTTVKTGADGEVFVTVMSGVGMRIGENSSVVMGQMEFATETPKDTLTAKDSTTPKDAKGKVTKRKAQIDLDEGTISTLLDDSEPEATDFKIKTPQGTAAARGTFYGVNVSGGQTFVQVKEGTVGYIPLAEDNAANTTSPATPEEKDKGK